MITITRAWLAVLFTATAMSADAVADVHLEWRYHVVGTPEFMGPPKIGAPSFVLPTPATVRTPSHVPCEANSASGEFDAYISEVGLVKEVRSHHVPVGGTSCQRQYILPVIRAWRFVPATFEGKTTPAHLWIGVAAQ